MVASRAPRLLALVNEKGEVGKTTTAVNLAAALAETGCRVLLLDLDPTGAASSWLGHRTDGAELRELIHPSHQRGSPMCVTHTGGTERSVRFDRHGLSFELDRLCRKKAFEKIRELRTDKKIFVNTLTMTIHDPEFRGAYLQELLDDLRMKPENVIFEVSEKMAIDNYDMFRAALKDYTDIGIVHASDDIGTGHSDLERIMELKPGFMKIDISFVKDVDKSYIKQEIVKAMIQLSKGINSTIIAEGVETREEMEKLKELGVEYAQGYLFAEPEDHICDEIILD